VPLALHHAQALTGQVFAIFVITVRPAAEAAVALAIIISPIAA